ncbi:hypothetical protein ACEU6E_05200 [Halorutilales archaeon Cl-col2-1]
MVDIESEYTETDESRLLEFERDGRYVSVSVTKKGYGMLIVSDEKGEVERYYGFEMALDHAAEILGVSLNDLKETVPDEAHDMGM